MGVLGTWLAGCFLAVFIVGCDTLDKGSVDIHGSHRTVVDAGYLKSNSSLVPWVRLTGRFAVVEPDGARTFLTCSGTLIKYYRVATAGHCFKDLSLGSDQRLVLVLPDDDGKLRDRAIEIRPTPLRKHFAEDSLLDYAIFAVPNSEREKIVQLGLLSFPEVKPLSQFEYKQVSFVTVAYSLDQADGLSPSVSDPGRFLAFAEDKALELKFPAAGCQINVGGSGGGVYAKLPNGEYAFAGIVSRAGFSQKFGTNFVVFQGAEHYLANLNLTRAELSPVAKLKE